MSTNSITADEPLEEAQRLQHFRLEYPTQWAQMISQNAQSFAFLFDVESEDRHLALQARIVAKDLARESERTVAPYDGAPNHSTMRQDMFDARNEEPAHVRAAYLLRARILLIAHEPELVYRIDASGYEDYQGSSIPEESRLGLLYALLEEFPELAPATRHDPAAEYPLTEQATDALLYVFAKTLPHLVPADVYLPWRGKIGH